MKRALCIAHEALKNQAQSHKPHIPTLFAAALLCWRQQARMAALHAAAVARHLASKRTVTIGRVALRAWHQAAHDSAYERQVYPLLCRSVAVQGG